MSKDSRYATAILSPDFRYELHYSFTEEELIEIHTALLFAHSRAAELNLRAFGDILIKVNSLKERLIETNNKNKGVQ